MSWEVALRPVRGQDGSLTFGGLAIMLVNGDDEEELCRVAFARDKGKDPDADFIEKLLDKIEDAEAARDVVNEFDAKVEQSMREFEAKIVAIRTEAAADARAKLVEIIEPVKGRGKKKKAMV